MNNSQFMITVIGDELKSGFFLALQEECDIDHQKMCDLWDQYYEINHEGDETEKKEKKEKREKKEKKKEVEVCVDEEKPIKKASGVKKSIPQGKTSAISRADQTPVQFSAIDKLKVAELKSLNKERGLPISGNKAILTDALKCYEKTQGIDDEVENVENDEVGDDDDEKKKRKPSKKKSEKKDEAKITIVKKKKSEKQAPPVVALIKPEELKSYKDEYGNIVVADDLVCEETDDGTRIVVGYKLIEDKDDAIYGLDTEHMEKCKELNLEFRIEDNFEP